MLVSLIFFLAACSAVVCAFALAADVKSRPFLFSLEFVHQW